MLSSREEINEQQVQLKIWNLVYKIQSIPYWGTEPGGKIHNMGARPGSF